MSQRNAVGVRQSIRLLQEQYDAGDRKPLEDVVRAWKGIQALPASDPRSFFVIGGYHGEPFELRPAVDVLSTTDIYAYWGGYCNHGNVLFPTWHRVYVRKLEEALQSIVPDVMMPFWDETDVYTAANGIPAILTQPTFELDGQTIHNPLRSFVLPENVNDDYWADSQKSEHHAYYKPAGYETVRYPLSGLVGNEKDRKKTELHNARFPDEATNTACLNRNLRAWLYGGNPTPAHPDPNGTGIYARYRQCLRAPNYTVFSNTTSAQAWNRAGHEHAVALEDPHNDIHLAVGGFDLPSLGGPGSLSGQIEDSNGDMGENNTAGLDPIFFFHHCNVDRMFWLWQKQHGQTDHLEVIEGYAGTDSSASQGPTPGVPPGTPLDMKTPLNPFKHPLSGTPYTSEDCMNIETQLGYTYGQGSLEKPPPPRPLKAGHSSKSLMVSGIDRALFQGSFLITAWASIEGADGPTTERYLGHHAALSRFSVIHCANCRTHLEVVAHFPLDGLTDEEVSRATFRVHITHRGDSRPAGLVTKLSVHD